MQVYYVELDKSDGTRALMPDGNRVDEERASLPSGEQTVQSLKEFIFPGERKLGRVAVYANGGNGWIRKEPREALALNTLYGYVDARKVVAPTLPPNNGTLQNTYTRVYAHATPQAAAMALYQQRYGSGAQSMARPPPTFKVNAKPPTSKVNAKPPKLVTSKATAAPLTRAATGVVKKIYNIFPTEEKAFSKCVELGVTPIAYEGEGKETPAALQDRLHTMQKACGRARRQQQPKTFESDDEAKKKCVSVGIPYVPKARRTESAQTRAYRLHDMYMLYTSKKREQYSRNRKAKLIANTHT